MMSGVIALLFTAIFLLDVLTPLGLPISILYVVPLGLTSWLRPHEARYWLAGASSAATLCGYFLSPSLSGVPTGCRLLIAGFAWPSSGSQRRLLDGNET
jgi:hypothetical protein